MRRLIRRLMRKQQKGQSVVILALGMVALLGFVGITTDVSLLFVRYATLRRAVDAAAIAAAGQMRQDRSIATVSLTARSFIEFHGLNPREVWVEACHNQPRPDNDPNTPGLQNAPPQTIIAYRAYDDAKTNLSLAIQGGTVDLVDLRNTYVTAARNYMNVAQATASGVSGAVITLGTTADIALNTYGGYTTTVDIAANYTATDDAVRAYIEALQEFIPPEWTEDLEICTAEQRKLVRVTAQVDSPTVFLRVLGWDNVRLQASAVSETAVLDVVIVMDVSESMLFDTTIQDWEKVHMAVAYLPPRIQTPMGQTIGGLPAELLQNNHTVLGQMVRDGHIPSWTGFGQSTAEARPPDSPFAQPAFLTANPSFAPYIAPYPRANGNVINGYADTYETWIEGWFWGAYLLGVPQVDVNRRLYYLDIGQPLNGNPPAIDTQTTGPLGAHVAPIPANPEPNFIRNQYYQVRSAVPTGVENPSQQTHPREACRVRFYPFSMILPEIPAELREIYQTDFGMTYTQWSGMPAPSGPEPKWQWSGFVPAYNFYGCCNDPSSGYVDRNGDFYSVTVVNGVLTTGPFLPSEGNWSNDHRFDDLICQPMKQARDATRLFLERIDFLRGDRVGFVTFDKSAYIIDPDGANGKPGFANLSHMIEELPLATEVLNMYIGVRAEPNYYVWNDDGGGWVDDTGVTQFAAGFDSQNNIIPVNFDCDSSECPPPGMDDFISTPALVVQQESIDPAYLNYPVFGNCSIQNAELPYPFSRFATRNTTDSFLNDKPALFRIMNPPATGPGSVPLWTAYRRQDGNRLDNNNAYEKQGLCRGTNIGAALRVGNNALTDPRTTRRAGTVWIMILLSDGAAGASDPVRRNGYKIDQAFPYEQIKRFDWRQRANPNNEYGTHEFGTGISAENSGFVQRGGYGWLGLCPYGTPTNPGQLVKGDGLQFPYCSDPDPFTRNFCLKLPGETVGYPAPFGPGFAPGSKDRDYRDPVISGSLGESFPPTGWRAPDYAVETEGEYILDQNTQFGNIFDVDLGPIDNPENPCSLFYDVDDYARDWADFVAGVDEEQSGDAVLPTIFTIGFRLIFEDRPHPSPTNPSDVRTCSERHGGPGNPQYDACMCRINIEQCLGEELLRYIADAGDNFVIDNDIQQDWRNHNGFRTQVNLNKDVTNWGPKDPCENPFVNWFDPATTIADLAPRAGGENCGNYYNAPGVAELQQVFDDIASRMFTRLAG